MCRLDQSKQGIVQAHLHDITWQQHEVSQLYSILVSYKAKELELNPHWGKRKGWKGCQA